MGSCCMSCPGSPRVGGCPLLSTLLVCPRYDCRANVLHTVLETFPQFGCDYSSNATSALQKGVPIRRSFTYSGVYPTLQTSGSGRS